MKKSFWEEIKQDFTLQLNKDIQKFRQRFFLYSIALILIFANLDHYLEKPIITNEGRRNLFIALMICTIVQSELKRKELPKQ